MKDSSQSADSSLWGIAAMIHSVMRLTLTATMNSYRQKPGSGKRAVSMMGCHSGQRWLAVGKFLTAHGRPAARVPRPVGNKVMFPSPGPTMNKQNNHHDAVQEKT